MRTRYIGCCNNRIACSPTVLSRFGLYTAPGRHAAVHTKTSARPQAFVCRSTQFTGHCAMQVAFNAFVTGTLFFRTRLHRNTVDDADLYLAALFFTLTAMLFNNWAEFAIVSERLSLFYKQVCGFDGLHEGMKRC